MDNELDNLNERLRIIITETCNKIGCDNCVLKWDDGCSACELQSKIFDIEMKEI